MEPIRLELRDEKGLIGTIDLPVEDLRTALGLGSGSADLGQNQMEPGSGNGSAGTEEGQADIARLKEQLAQAQRKTMDDFTPLEKAKFVIDWARGITPEEKAVFARAVGIPISSEAVVAESTEEPAIIQGKTDKPGYRYLESLDLSVKE